ncbi:MAG: ferrochelatase [Alphaproteobacteria bacterium]|nr:ferrochelatase [Alphaproteobacteria bacterium]MCB9931380.1 ferrochelatase [Alphaproteobacteria bacterium]
MTAYRLPPDHPPLPQPKVGVLLTALGTPDGHDPASMRRYLKEFLSDRRVIDVNRVLWWAILNGIILNTRPKKSGEAYARIWNEERDESPLRTITRAQAEGVAARLGDLGGRVLVDWGMRYGNPSIASRLEAMQQAGCTRVLLVPLYPQYAAATTATACDAAFAALMRMRWQPAFRTAPPWHDDPAYIAALAGSIRRHLAGLDWEPEVLLASFHGVPKRYLDLGDPYHCHCAKTARLLREALDWPEDRFVLSFQSRFGREEWLQPYTDQEFARLGREGVKRLAVVTPGFSADCLETLEEIAMTGAEQFRAAGGERFTFVPGLNDAPAHLDLLADLVRRELAGWV